MTPQIRAPAPRSRDGEVYFAPELESLLRAVGGAARAAGARAWAVGGVVRDALRGLSSTDVDVAVEGDAAAVARALAEGWRVPVEHFDAFGTATLRRPGGWRLDVVRARSEVYTAPGALPVVRPASIEDDLARRDFSVNAMAASLDPGGFGLLLDPWHGARDLAARSLRIMHRRAFVDDPTRLFRAARYAVRLGLEPDAATESAARAAVEGRALGTVSAERLRRDAELTCREAGWTEMHAWLNRWGVWGALAGWQPQATALRRADVALSWARRHRVHLVMSDPEFRFRAMLCLAPPSLTEALNARLAERRTARRARRIAASLREPETPAWCRAMDAEDVAPLVMALILARDDADKHRLTHYLIETRPVRLGITGHDLIAAGARPGPSLGAALDETLDALRAGDLAGRDGEIAFALRAYAHRESRGNG